MVHMGCHHCNRRLSRKIAQGSSRGECMRAHSRWPTVAVLFAFVSGCIQSPNGESAKPSSNGPTANAPSPPVMTVNQLMHGILFPLGNTVFYAQADDPAAISRD